ncbi:MAG: hypothetical protein R2731_04530 [Nocardioides sp.]
MPEQMQDVMHDGTYEALPEHVTMPLLTLVTRTSMDQDYAYVASRRAAGASRPAATVPRGWAWWPSSDCSGCWWRRQLCRPRAAPRSTPPAGPP